MPVPSSITDLDPVATNNSPQGSETVGPNANDYLQAAFAFIRQLYNGGMVPSADLNANSKKITNLAAGTADADAVNVAQMTAKVKAVYKVGEVKMWHGAVANIASTWGAGWQLADGTNGTADLRDRFIVGAGSTYVANATGGNATNTLTAAQLPSHSHTFSATTGGQSQPHTHGVNDPGHAHTGSLYSNTGSNVGALGGTGASSPGVTFVNASTTGISLGSNNVDHSHIVSGTTSAIGSGSAVENRPPYYALCLIEYTGIGVS